VEIKPISRRHYAHAPITEAIIALRFELGEGIGIPNLPSIQSALKSEYPRSGEQLAVHFELNTQERSGKSDRPQTIGYQFLSEDQKRIVRVSRTEFAFSQLAPYDRWETLRAEAKQVWAIVQKEIQPRRISGVGVRFINRIDIPCPPSGVELDDYFHAAPKIPPELPQGLRTYFVRLEIPFDPPAGVLILALAAVPPAATDVVSTLLDLDAVRQNLDTDPETAWSTIEELRDVKNAAFEASITDAARDLFK
jgi:uncharacterized protein (TIGR04255 family)